MRKGFISIISLIVMSVLLVMSLYLGYITKLEYLILNATKDNIQSYYLSEGKILMTIYEEKYYWDQLYPTLLDVFRTANFATRTKKIVIDKDDLEHGDNKSDVKIGFEDKNNRKNLILTTESSYNGVGTKVISSGTLVNKLFEMGDSILALSSIDEEYKYDLEQLMLKISKDISLSNSLLPGQFYGIEHTRYNKISLNKIDSRNYEISSYRDTMINPYVERFDSREVLIIIRNSDLEPVNFFIGDSNMSNQTIQLSGVIFVEGNVIIDSNFKFNGIIVVKDGDIEVKTLEKPDINGLIIFSSHIDYEIKENMDIKYNRNLVYKYGTFLPGFLEPKINLIKSN